MNMESKKSVYLAPQCEKYEILQEKAVMSPGIPQTPERDEEEW